MVRSSGVVLLRMDSQGGEGDCGEWDCGEGICGDIGEGGAFMDRSMGESRGGVRLGGRG